MQKFEEEPKQNEEFSEEEIKLFEERRKWGLFQERAPREEAIEELALFLSGKYDKWLQKKLEEEKQIIENRKKKLIEAIERIKKEIMQDKLKHIEAIILFGSMARGDATIESDMDFYIIPDDQKRFDLETFKGIAGIIDEELSDVQKQFGYGAITNEYSKAARFITGKSSKETTKSPAWVFAYVKDEGIQAKLDETLKKTCSTN